MLVGSRLLVEFLQEVSFWMVDSCHGRVVVFGLGIDQMRGNVDRKKAEENLRTVQIAGSTIKAEIYWAWIPCTNVLERPVGFRDKFRR